MKVNKWLDFADRVGWTAIYAAASAVALYLAGTDLSWSTGLKFVALQTVMAVVKVVLAQRAGDDDLGAAVPGGSVLEQR